MYTDLPRSLPVGGVRHAIRWDYRAALDCFEALNDPEFDDEARAYAVLHILYRDVDRIPGEHGQEAADRALWYLRGGRDTEAQTKRPRLVDWRQDFPIIAPPVARVLGYDIREARRRVHWWTVLAAFHEIGDCYFSQVVHIRSLIAKGQLKDKADKEFYRENKDVVDFQVELTTAEEDLLKLWIGGGVSSGEE